MRTISAAPRPLLRTGRLGALLPLIMLLLAPALCRAQEECRECPLPGFRSARDTLVKVHFRNQQAIGNCVSIRRIVAPVSGQEVQALRIRFWRDGVCADTVVAVAQVTALTVGGLGLGGQPLMVGVHPAREFYCGQEAELPTRFVELTALGGYGGSDTSRRAVGFDGMYFGAEALVAPFNSFPSDNFNLAFQAGLMSERGRLRFPLGAHIRWTFLGGIRAEPSQEFVPSECQFRTDEPSIARPDSACNEIDDGQVRDSSVYYLRGTRAVVDPFRPFLFAEGGIILDGGFTGSGRTPSVNEDDYGEYYLGGGVGLPLFDVATVSLGYRMMRLNLRTPCPNCVSDATGEPLYWVTNTNRIHSILLKLGWHFQFN